MIQQRSVTFTIPASPQAVLQRAKDGKTVVVIRVEDAQELADALTDAVRDAKSPPREDVDDS